MVVICVQMRVHESRELCLEEVKSKDTDRPATEGETLAVMTADGLPGSGEDADVREVVVERDVLVDELTRSETTREEKVIS